MIAGAATAKVPAVEDEFVWSEENTVPTHPGAKGAIDAAPTPLAKTPKKP